MGNSNREGGGLGKALFAVITALWIGFVGWRTLANWPRASLDLSADPTTRTALDAAQTEHVLMAALLALAVPAITYVVGSFLYRLVQQIPAGEPAVRRTAGGPARVLLMRHAEKTGDPDDIHLSAPGVARAARLASYIPETFGKPHYIFAAARSKRSIRSIETVTPLAEAIGVPVRHDIEDKKFPELVAHLFADPVYRDTIVVVCWHHGKIPEIADLLGAPEGSYPDPWPQDMFNLIVDIRYSANGTAMARQVIQAF